MSKGRTGTGRTTEQGSAALQQAVSGRNAASCYQVAAASGERITACPTCAYLWVGIEGFSRELYAALLPDKTHYAAETFVKQILDAYAYTIAQLYADNGLAYRGNPDTHALMKLCSERRIEQRCTKVRTPRTHGKAERVIRTLMQMWHRKTMYKSRAHRRVCLMDEGLKDRINPADSIRATRVTTKTISSSFSKNFVLKYYAVLY